MVDNSPASRSRAAIAAAGVAAILLALVAGYAGALSIGLGTCGGDGGQPYAGSGSQLDRLCGSAGQGLELAELAGVPLIAVLATALAFMRRRFRALLVGVGLAMLAFLGPFLVLSSASTKTQPPPCQWYDETSDYCS
jgi:hypothetical protein